MEWLAAIAVFVNMTTLAMVLYLRYRYWFPCAMLAVSGLLWVNLSMMVVWRGLLVTGAEIGLVICMMSIQRRRVRRV